MRRSHDSLSERSSSLPSVYTLSLATAGKVRRRVGRTKCRRARGQRSRVDGGAIGRKQTTSSPAVLPLADTRPRLFVRVETMQVRRSDMQGHMEKKTIEVYPTTTVQDLLETVRAAKGFTGGARTSDVRANNVRCRSVRSVDFALASATCGGTACTTRKPTGGSWKAARLWTTSSASGYLIATAA